MMEDPSVLSEWKLKVPSTLLLRLRVRLGRTKSTQREPFKDQRRKYVDFHFGSIHKALLKSFLVSRCDPLYWLGGILEDEMHHP
jgi:hypothetical protein